MCNNQKEKCYLVTKGYEFTIVGMAPAQLILSPVICMVESYGINCYKLEILRGIGFLDTSMLVNSLKKYFKKKDESFEKNQYN